MNKTKEIFIPSDEIMRENLVLRQVTESFAGNSENSYFFHRVELPLLSKSLGNIH